VSQFQLFVGGAYTSQSPIADDEQLINWYVEVMESPGAVTKATLYPTPGFSSFSTTTSSGGRAMFSLNGRCFAIINVTLYEITSDGTATSRGTVANDGLPATICGNGDAGEELFITSGDVGYVYDLSADTLSTVLASGAAMGGMLDGYFVSLNPATSQFRLSDLNDGSTWDVTQFAARSIAPDAWTSMVVTSYGQIWLLGSQTSEVWFNAGTAPFSFAPDPSGLIPFGCAARFSAKEASDRVVWLATSINGGLQVVEATGFTPTRISTHAVDYAISQYSDVSDALGDVYSAQGHLFYVLTFPTAQRTWVYDFTTRLWHERRTWDSATSTWKALRTMFGCSAFTRRLVADRQGGDIYTQSIDFTEDAGGDLIRRVRRSPAVFAQHERIRFADLEVFLESGLGTTSGQGVDPQVTLRSSNDGGKTWGNERSVSAGALGEYRKRVRFRRLGSSRDRVFEMSVTDPIPWRIVDAFVSVATTRVS
jgi:hypothetical protein